MTEIRCRIKRSLWWMVPLGVLECGFMLITPFLMAAEQPKPPFSPSPYLIYWICGPAALGFGFAVLLMIRSLLYEEVIATEDGLRWRGAFGPWRSARWNEVFDFYLSSLKHEPTLETAQGKFKLESALTNRAQMQQLVAQRATRAPSRVWEMQKFRASKPFTQRFSYWTKSQRWTAPILSLGAVYTLGFIGWGAIFNSQPTARAIFTPNAPFDWLSLLMALFAFGPIAGLCAFVVPMMWRHRRFAFQHRSEHLEISPLGLAWQNEEKRIEANWDEVRAIDFVPGDRLNAHFRVATRNGDFVVWRALEPVALWLGLVRQFAPHLAPEIPLIDPALGGEAETWSGLEVGVGVRRFHFRSRDTRLVLLCATVFGLFLPLLPLLNEAVKTSDDAPSSVPWPLCVALFLLCVVVLFYVWLCFARAAIWADEVGLEWRLPFLPIRRVAWSEIEAIGRDESGPFFVVGGQKRRLFTLSAPVREEELRQLIEERATKATGNFN